MTNIRQMCLVSVAMVAFVGCASAESEDVGVASEAALATNALATNALATNALATNALATNALATNALATNSLSSLQDPSPAGDAFRQLVKYTVGCALTPSQTFSFSWTDSTGVVHDNTYTGLLGLAPGWTSGPLDLAGQQAVSACLAARTNYYGITVDISLRADLDVLTDNTSASELGTYSYIEGAFWGNVFASTPYLRSCYRDENVDHSRAAMRDCAAGHVNSDGTVAQCGMIQRVGSCADVCKKLWKQTGYYTHCGGDDVTSSDVLITVGLQ